MVSEQFGEERKARRFRVAPFTGWSGVAQEARERCDSLTSLQGLHLHHVRQNVSEPHNEEEASEILPSQLQDAPPPEKARHSGQTNLSSLHDLRNTLSPAENRLRVFAALRRPERSAAREATVVRVEAAGQHDVYDLTIPGTGCFTSSGGVVLSNCDALRYTVTTCHMKGHVHVYRCWETPDGAALGWDGIAKEIHHHSGWGCPDGGDIRDLGMYAPDIGRTIERYVQTVGDRARPGGIKAMIRYGIPCIPYRQLAKGSGSRGQVKDGIGWLTSLIRNAAPWESETPDPEEQLFSGIEKAKAKYQGRRPILMPYKDSRRLARANDRQRASLNLTDEPGSEDY